jgi:hypothetical protein
VLEFSEDAGRSILLDPNTVIGVCGGTRISVGKDSSRGVRIVNIDTGDFATEGVIDVTDTEALRRDFSNDLSISGDHRRLRPL